MSGLSQRRAWHGIAWHLSLEESGSTRCLALAGSQPPRTPQAKRDVVDRVIENLSLQSCRNTRIGSATHRGISGGEVWDVACVQREAHAKHKSGW